MKVRIIITEFPVSMGTGKSIPQLKELEKSLFEIFVRYHPKPSDDITGTYGYPAYELSATPNDPQFEKDLAEFSALLKKARPPAAAILRETTTPDETKRSRFLEPYYSGSYVEAANPGMLLCQECEYPNLANMPESFLVNRDVLKKYDIFHTGVSLIIVRPRVLELLKNAVGDQIQFGETALAKAKVKATGDDRLFWVRPKEILGEKLWVANSQRTCPACKRVLPYIGGMTDFQVNKAGPGLFDDRYWVAHFGSGKAEIALVPEGGTSWRKKVMSGALLAHFKANDVKGIVAFTKQLDARCLFSQKGEPTLDAQARTFTGAPNLEKKKQDGAKLQQARATTVLLKGTPWNCAADGYVYFHLSTPGFVVLDPMTVEEDSGGPYVIKNFNGPGLYRLPVSAIKNADEEKRGVAVDSATLLFVDNMFLSEFLDAYEWEKAITAKGEPDTNYHQRIAEEIGTRFGICTTPPQKFKSEFIGDGFYRIDAKSIKPVKT